MADRQLPLCSEDRAITRMIVDRVRRRGNSLAQISRTSGVELNRLVRLARAAGVHYRNRHASPERILAAIKAVTDEGLAFRAAARRYGMSKTAVHRFVQKHRNAIVDSVGDLKVQRRDWRCEVHGRISIFPCVACAAQIARDL